MTTERIVLITGGTSGIGFGLAVRYARTGARLVLTGRSSERLRDATGRIPGSVGVAGDLSLASDRERLAEHVRREFGRLDVLVNNAGIQRRIGIASDHAAWPERQSEVDLLLSAPIHLVALLLPTLRAAEGGQIVDVTSGGAFTPQPFAPTYSAAKAALHSYTVNLRSALADTAIAVTELIPPAVATGLAGPGSAHGADLDAFCDDVFPRLEAREDEVGFGATATPAFRALLDAEHERFAASVARSRVARFPAAV